jgi:hypothetical protein
MSSKRRKDRPGRGRPPLSKEMLLPMARKRMREESTAYHLALAACRSGQGNGYLINELVRTVYLTWFLQRSGFGDEPIEHFRIVEYAVEAALSHADRTGEWHLDEDAVPSLERLLAQHDSQLNEVPLHYVADAERQLRRFLAGTDPSPIPDGNV